MAYEIVWEDKGVYWKYRGRVTGNEIVEASTSIYGDPRFITLKYKFVDFLDADSVDIDRNQLALIAYQHLAAERANPYIKNVILINAGNQAVADEFASFFDKSSWEVKVFTDMDEANRWAGRQPASETQRDSHSLHSDMA
jgi:hypothetical protein